MLQHEILKIQEIEVFEPVPSLSVHKVKYEKGMWKFVYTIKTPQYLSEEVLKNPLYMYGAFQNLTLKTNIHKNMVQVSIRSLKDIFDLLDKQRKEDITFRDLFIKNNTFFQSFCKPHTFILSNTTHVFSHPTFIAGIKRINKRNTEFIGIKKAGKKYGKL